MNKVKKYILRTSCNCTPHSLKANLIIMAIRRCLFISLYFLSKLIFLPQQETAVEAPKVHSGTVVAKPCFQSVIIKFTLQVPLTSITQQGFSLTHIHTQTHKNKTKLQTFFTPVDTAATCRADLESHCAFSVCVCASLSFKYTL